LLSLRTEPGLIGLTNLSTTIQSTPSNYLRRHGGKATPFIEIASEPSRHGKFLYDGKHHDWGNYYLNKTKRFLVIHVGNPPDAPSGYCWVELEVARSLLAEDNLITNDLRVCLPLVLNHQTAVPGRLFENAPTNDVTHLGESDFLPNAVDSRGTKVSFYRTETQTREVASWIQPLLVPREAMKLELSFCEENGSRLFAIKRGTRPGLLGCHLWFPAEVKGGHVAQRVLTSAEGGRFWKFQIQITLRHVESRSAAIPSQESLTWVTEVELAALVAQPLQTSLELRMAWSLVISRLTGLKPNA
jgi:oxidase EvaA